MSSDTTTARPATAYDRLGLRPVINASATLTALGGSRMPPVALEAMDAAARSFIDLREMERSVSTRVAELTQNEAAYISSGAAAGIVVSVAACIAGTDPERIAAFPLLEGCERCEVIIHKSQRNGYDYAARQTGADMVEIGGTAEELTRAITNRTACVLWFAGSHYATDALPLRDVVAIAHKHRVPVIVDAAAQIPPVSNLWRFTRDDGADLAIFSGGKGLRGPQSSGLVLGRTDLIEGCRANGNPNHSIGRPMKVGKEELAGVLAAIEWSLAQDEEAVLAAYEATVQDWIKDLATLPGVSAERGYPSEAGQPHGRAILHIAPPCPLSRDQIVEALWDRNPRVAVAKIGDAGIALNPQSLEAGEAELVRDAFHEVLGTR